MKQLIVWCIIVAATINLGCENRLFTYTVSINQSGQFNVSDADGVFVTSAFISRTAVAKALDLPQGARVLELKIESLSLRVGIAPGNAAISVNVTGFLGTSPTSTKTLFQDTPVVLAGVNVPGIGLNSLIEENLGKLRTELENFVKGLGTGSLVELAVSGTSTPSGSSIAITIYLDIKATVKYERCEEVLIGMSDAPSCDGGGNITN